jgi:hypothetical protein
VVDVKIEVLDGNNAEQVRGAGERFSTAQLSSLTSTWEGVAVAGFG